MAQMPFTPCTPDAAGNCDDRSVQMLTSIFGDVITKLTQGVDPGQVQSLSILSEMFRVFNSGILVVAALIVGYVAVMGVANTANDGEAFGQQWSTAMTPARIVAGGAVLLPTTSGYSFIQIIVLTFALWGVGFANGIYNAGMAMGIMSPTSMTQDLTNPGQYFGLRDFAQNYVQSAYCARLVNSLYSSSVALSSTPYATLQKDGMTSRAYQWADTNSTTNLAGGGAICGTVTQYDYTAQTSGASSSASSNNATFVPITSGQMDAVMENFTQTLVTAKTQAVTSLEGGLNSWVSGWPTTADGWSSVDASQMNTLLNSAEANLATTLSQDMTQTQGPAASGLQQLQTTLTAGGWSMAGGWYQRVGMVRSNFANLLSSRAAMAIPPNTGGIPPNSAAGREFVSLLKTSSDAILKTSLKDGKSYQPNPAVQGLEVLVSLIPTNPSYAFSLSFFMDNASKIISYWTESSERYVVDMVTGAGSNGTSAYCGTAGVIGGSINRMKCVGDWMTVTSTGISAVDFAIKNAITALRLAADIVSAGEVVGTGAHLSPAGVTVWTWYDSTFAKWFAQIVEKLDYLGFLFGVVIPSMPYGIFMIVVVGWLLGVLQAVVAAPLWAVMHMTPDRTFIGSNSQGYYLLLTLFARPALAILGLIAGMLLSDPIINYTADAFFGFHSVVTRSDDLLGAVTGLINMTSWFKVFGWLMVGALYMAFALPQTLPDNVLSWIGAGQSSLGETSAQQTWRGQMEREAGNRFLERNAGGGGGGGGGSNRPKQLTGPKSQGPNPMVSGGTQGAAQSTAPPPDQVASAPAAQSRRRSTTAPASSDSTAASTAAQAAAAGAAAVTAGEAQQRAERSETQPTPVTSHGADRADDFKPAQSGERQQKQTQKQTSAADNGLVATGAVAGSVAASAAANKGSLSNLGTGTSAGQLATGKGSGSSTRTAGSAGAAGASVVGGVAGGAAVTDSSAAAGSGNDLVTNAGTESIAPASGTDNAGTGSSMLAPPLSPQMEHFAATNGFERTNAPISAEAYSAKPKWREGMASPIASGGLSTGSNDSGSGQSMSAEDAEHANGQIRLSANGYRPGKETEPRVADAFAILSQGPSVDSGSGGQLTDE